MIRSLRLESMLFVVLVISASVHVSARLYDGAGPGESTIGTGGDYTTLQSAADDFNSFPLTGGDWTFLVLSDLSQTEGVTFDQDTGGNRVTLRPAPGTSPTITFLAGGSSGGLFFGDPGDGVKNFTIDGATTAGETERHLTIRNTTSTVAYDTVSFAGDSDGSAIRNCILDNHFNGSGNFISACVVFYRSQFLGPGLVPDNCTVENCSMTNLGSPISQGVVAYGGSLVSSGNTGMENIIIRSNDMNVAARGVWLHNVRSGLIENNTVAVNQTSNAYQSYGILLNDLGNAVGNLDITIRNNHFTRINGNSNFNTIGVTGLSVENTGTTATYRVYNNMFGGIKEVATSARTAGLLQGISFVKAGNAHIFVQYNSIDVLAPDAPYSGLTRDNCFGIGSIDGSFSGTALITNNIVRMGASYGTVLRIPTVGTWTTDDNDLYPADPGAVTGRKNSTDYATLGAWQAATSQDAGSVALNPLVPQPPALGQWIASTAIGSDLHFSSQPGTGYYSTPVTSITLDLDEDARDLVQPFMGADESTNPLIQDEFPSTAGWSPFGFNVPRQSSDYDATHSALLATVQMGPGYRIVGWISFGSGEEIPYAAVGTGNYARGKFYIYAGGQTTSAVNEIPNMRMRLANRFAVTSVLTASHHAADDPEGATLAQDFRPSTNPSSPSLYRVDLDPIDVPYLVTNGSTEGILRAFEAYSNEPQDNGYIALTESSVNIYPALPDTTSPAVLIKVYQPGASDAGDFASSITTLLCLDYNHNPETTAPLPVVSSGAFGVTLDSTNIPSDRIGIAAVDFPTGAQEDSDYTKRARVEEGRQYKIRFHATSTQLSNHNAQFRFRARTIKWQWNHNLEVGGAGAASVINNTIAGQALPGVGCQNPDSSGENGGWYTLLFQSPLNKDIRSDFPPGTDLSVSMPHISAQDPPGVHTGTGNVHSRRDIMFGIDVIDTFDMSSSAGYIESGNITLDRIEVRQYSQVQD